VIRALAIVALAACGRLGFDERDPSVAGELGPTASTRTIGVDPDELRDSEAWLAFPDRNFGAGDHVSIDTDETGLVWFDLSGVPASAIVQAATLSVTTKDRIATTGTIGIHRVREEWNEGTVVDSPGATNWYERMPGQTWTAEGVGVGSRDAEVLATFSPGTFETTYTIALPAEVVQEWVADPSTNFGLALVAIDTDDHVHLHSRESGGRWPTLTIDVTELP
jgi:hypothetical protein